MAIVFVGQFLIKETLHDHTRCIGILIKPEESDRIADLNVVGIQLLGHIKSQLDFEVGIRKGAESGLVLSLVLCIGLQERYI